MDSLVEIDNSKPEEIQITFIVKSYLAGKIFIFICSLALFVMDVVLLVNFDPKEDKGLVFAILATFVFNLLVPFRLFLWNTFGKEIVIVNSNKVYWQRFYGLYSGKLKEKQVSEIDVSLVNVREYEKVIRGHLMFADYKGANETRVEAFICGVEITQQQALNIEKILYLKFRGFTEEYYKILSE